jgi:hypothetical protein
MKKFAVIFILAVGALVMNASNGTPHPKRLPKPGDRLCVIVPAEGSCAGCHNWYPADCIDF